MRGSPATPGGSRWRSDPGIQASYRSRPNPRSGTRALSPTRDMSVRPSGPSRRPPAFHPDYSVTTTDRTTPCEWPCDDYVFHVNTQVLEDPGTAARAQQTSKRISALHRAILEQEGERRVALAPLDIYSHALIDDGIATSARPVTKRPMANRALSGRSDAHHRPAERAGGASSLERACWSYAVTSVPCGVWLGRSSSFSPVRRAWAKPSPTNTAMTPARQNAAIAHHKAMAAIRLNP